MSTFKVYYNLAARETPLVRKSKCILYTHKNVVGEYKKRMFVKSHYIVECQSPEWTGDWFPRQDFISFVFTRKLLKHFIGNVNFFPERRLQITSYWKDSFPHQVWGNFSFIEGSV